MPDKRIIDYNQADTLESDDYLIIDGSTNGTRKIKPNQLQVATDKTLSIENSPADAKKVGDEITDIKADLSYNFESNIDDKIVFIAGINRAVSNGVLSKPTSSTKRGSSVPFTPSTRLMRIIQTGTVTLGIHGCINGVWQSNVFPNMPQDAIIDVSNYDELCFQLIKDTTVTSDDFPVVYSQKLTEIEAQLNGDVLQLTSNDFISGVWGGRIIRSNANRLSTKKLINVRKGDVIRYSNPTLKIAFGIYEYDSVNLNFNSGWENADSVYREIICPNTGALIVMVEGSNLVPSDFDCDITIYNSAYELIRHSRVGTARTVAFLGDSITAGSGTNNAYHMYIASRFGWTCKNYGYGGSGYARSYPSTGGKMATGQVGIGVTITSSNKIEPNDFLTRIATIDTAIDGLVIFGGTNDWAYGDTISVETFETAVNNVFTYAQTHFGRIPIVVLLPIHRNNDSTPNETTGKTLEDYCDIIKRIAIPYGIRCIDLFAESGLNPANQNNNDLYYIRDDTNVSDGLHPNHYAHKIISDLVAPALYSVLY